jgi:hypothetical protein
MKIANELAAEYGAWYGWTSGIGRYVALGEYILEETESDQPHDEWLMVAREAFLKWKEVHGITMTPPPPSKKSLGLSQLSQRSRLKSPIPFFP